MRALLACGLLLLSSTIFAQSQTEVNQAEVKQPIEFNHRLHVTELKQKCEACHPNADPGEMMGMPEVAACMQCHASLPARSAATRKLAAFARQAREVDWVRIYQIPTFVSFNHRAHIRSGASCTNCHGPVAERTQLTKEKDVSMGACINCHLANRASIDCSYCHEAR